MLGYRVRVYVPFGREWYPYFMRRLAERPANVLFLARNLLPSFLRTQLQERNRD
jgi:proline dehydrogenase